ncbi:flagellar hook-associated protein FlgK [Bacillus sp. FJAT-27251]|uniref:flagellar hook-associated protein FlgK n=1 Tax=Bacillus sp. FJAT-27251 TaxID=1684142 RepID=UPI0006A76F7B|nr:flagellar hook-associated protein FlgK [Bacillus sp. FJAT-27251]
MVSTFHSLELGKRGLYAGQAGVTTSGHNMANANTKGYSRQQVNVTASPSLDVWTSGQVNPGQLGSGVSLDSITRVRDSFLDRQYREQSAAFGEWSVQQDALSKLETIVNEPSETGLRAAMDQFWGAWEDLANEPDSLSARAVIKESAQALVGTAQQMDRSMGQLKNDLNQQASAKINDANGYLELIADLNQSIRRTGVQANDLLDKRDVYVEELSKLVSINVVERDGMYSIKLASDGTSLVEGTNIGTVLDSGSNVGSGSILGTFKSIEAVDSYQQQLNDMVKGLVFGDIKVEIPGGSNLADGTAVPAGQTMQITVKGINGLQQLGWSMKEDASGNVQPGAPLFVGDEDNFTIASLEVNPAIVADIRLIASSLRSEVVNGQQKAVAGNGQLAQLMGGLRNHDVSINGESGSIHQFYQSMISGLGAESQRASRFAANQEAALIATENRRQSVTGVSLDEEMANLIKYQHAYNAAARVVTTTDQMLDTIINRMAAR